MKAFLKWAGGKSQLLAYIEKFINLKNLKNNTYYEPFIGGGSVFFKLGHSNCVINDLNEEVINTYSVIKNHPKELILKLKEHQKKHNKEYYYKVRALDRDVEEYKKMTNIERAARTIYLNKTCYNGLYRVNRNGFFNTPVGRYENPLICDELTIIEDSKYLKQNNIKMTSVDFSKATSTAKCGDWIYFDPPYDYEESGFVSYVKEGFSHDDLIRLKRLCDDLIERDCNVLISNNETKFVKELFKSDNYEIIYKTKRIKANRTINSKKERRKKVNEVLIYGRKK